MKTAAEHTTREKLDRSSSTDGYGASRKDGSLGFAPRRGEPTKSSMWSLAMECWRSHSALLVATEEIDERQAAHTS